jgi:hypothetical protein
MKRWLLPACAVLFAAACSRDPAAYMISGSDVAITVERIKPNFWTGGWQLDLVVSQYPNCQRRYHLKPTGSSKVKVELYSPERGVYILRQGKRWYVAELRTCGYQIYDEPPPEPGDLVGTFQESGGAFKFVENQDKATNENGSAEGE